MNRRLHLMSTTKNVKIHFIFIVLYKETKIVQTIPNTTSLNTLLNLKVRAQLRLQTFFFFAVDMEMCIASRLFDSILLFRS